MDIKLKSSFSSEFLFLNLVQNNKQKDYEKWRINEYILYYFMNILYSFREAVIINLKSLTNLCLKIAGLPTEVLFVKSSMKCYDRFCIVGSRNYNILTA